MAKVIVRGNIVDGEPMTPALRTIAAELLAVADELEKATGHSSRWAARLRAQAERAALLAAQLGEMGTEVAGTESLTPS